MAVDVDDVRLVAFAIDYVILLVGGDFGFRER